MEKQDIRKLLREVDQHAGSAIYLHDLFNALAADRLWLHQALAVWTRVILVSPQERATQSLLWSTRANLLFRTDRINEALAAALKAKALDESNYQAWERMAMCYCRLQRLDDALGAFALACSKSLNALPGERVCLFRNYAVVLEDTGNAAAAARYRRLAETLSPLPRTDAPRTGDALRRP